MKPAILPCLLLSTLLLPTASTAQQPGAPPPVKEKIEVKVTSIDFVATDAKGNIVSGLDPKNITVVENGATRAVTGFSEVRRATPGADAKPRRIAIFIDDSSLTTQTRKKVMNATAEFARSAATRGDLVEVVTFNTAMVIRQAWTDDTALIDKVFAVITREVPGGMKREAERRRIKNQIEMMLGDSSGGAPAGGGLMNFDMVVAGAKNYATERAAEVDRTASALVAYIQPLQSIPGKKTMILASESLPVRPGADIAQYVTSVQQQVASGGGPLATGASRNSTSFEEGRNHKGEVLSAVAQIAWGSDVTIYGLNPAAQGDAKFASNVESTNFSASPGAEMASGVGGADGLQLLANQTGGVALIGMQPQKAFEKIDAEIGSYYSISYQSDLESGKPRQLEITSSDPNVRLRYPRRTTVSLAPTAAPLLDSDLFTSPPPNDMNISLQKGRELPISLDQRQVQLIIVIPVDNLRFEEKDGGFAGGFDVSIQFGDKAGKVLSTVNRQSQPIQWTPAQVASAKGVNINFASDVVVSKDREIVAVRIVDKVSGATGSAKIDMGAPAQ